MISRGHFENYIISTILSHEGGYANHPADKGGETYRGISRKANPNWEGWKYIDDVKRTGKGLNGWLSDKWDDVKNYSSDKWNQGKELVSNTYNSVFSSNTEKYTIPTNTIFPEMEGAVKDLYYQKYFVANGFDGLTNIEVAKFLFDYAVHGGYKLITLQQLINSNFPGHGKNGGNIAEDNTWGTETRNAVNAIGAGLLPHLISWRKGHLDKIVAKDPTQKVFEDGWNKRLASFAPVQFAKNNKNYIFIGLGVLVTAGAAYYLYSRNKTNKVATTEETVNV